MSDSAKRKAATPLGPCNRFWDVGVSKTRCVLGDLPSLQSRLNAKMADAGIIGSGAVYADGTGYWFTFRRESDHVLCGFRPGGRTTDQRTVDDLLDFAAGLMSTWYRIEDAEKTP